MARRDGWPVPRRLGQPRRLRLAFPAADLVLVAVCGVTLVLVRSGMRGRGWGRARLGGRLLIAGRCRGGRGSGGASVATWPSGVHVPRCSAGRVGTAWFGRTGRCRVVAIRRGRRDDDGDRLPAIIRWAGHRGRSWSIVRGIARCRGASDARHRGSSRPGGRTRRGAGDVPIHVATHGPKRDRLRCQDATAQKYGMAGRPSPRT